MRFGQGDRADRFGIFQQQVAENRRDMKQPSLEEWIARLLERRSHGPIGLLQEVDEPGSGSVPDELLLRLHHKIRGTDPEDAIWQIVIGQLQKPLPICVAHDLIDRSIAREALGHSRQANEIQWRLASGSDEALLTLAVDYYTDSIYSLAELRRVFAAFPAHSWMFQTLARRQASSPEKEQMYLECVRQHPENASLQRLIDSRKLAQRAKSSTINGDEAITLFATGEPDVWRSLASNPQTPTDILAVLVQARQIKFAKEIRTLAHRNLRSRQER